MIKAFITPERASFLQRRLDVAERTAMLFSRLFDSEMLVVDYLSIFTKSEEERRRLDHAALGLGKVLFNKRGRIYKLHAEPSDIVRVRDPNPETELRGCVDYVADDYSAIRRKLMGVSGCTEAEKSINGRSYSIIEATEPELQVSVYFPSIRLTTAMMGEIS